MYSLIPRVPNAAATLRCLGLLLGCLVCSSLHAQTLHPQVLAPLKVAIYPSPYGYQDEQGVARGVTPDLIIAIANHMGWEAEFVHMPYLRAVHELKTGGIDLMNGMNIPTTAVSLPPESIAAQTSHTTLPISLYSLENRGIDIQTRAQAKHYRIGSVRFTSTEQRTPWLDQGNTHYYEDADNLMKALLAKRVDLATLDPIGAAIISQQLGIKLQRVYDYGSLESVPLFSPASSRIQNIMEFCQGFLAAQIEIYDNGGYADILKAHHMSSLLTYHQSNYTPNCRVMPAD